MRKVKYLIPVLILFLTIGFASVNSSLSMNGDTIVNSDIDDFNVYFSNVLVNGERDLSIVQSSTQLDFSTILEDLGNTYVIEYEITNGSSAFDANVSINCSDSNEYLEVSNDFDSEELKPYVKNKYGFYALAYYCDEYNKKLFDENWKDFLYRHRYEAVRIYDVFIEWAESQLNVYDITGEGLMFNVEGP